MLKKLNTILMTVILLAAFTSPMSVFGKANARKGKYLYRKHCRTCHKDGGSAKALSPISKTQAEWDKVFKSYKSLACKDEWEKRKKKDMKDLHAHLWGHAYDSPSPAKCE